MTTVGEHVAPRRAPYLQPLICLPPSWLWSHTHAAGVLLRGSRSADYLITTSTTYNIPLADPLSLSPTLICLNEPGLLFQEMPVYCMNKRRGQRGAWHPPSDPVKVKASHTAGNVDKCESVHAELIYVQFWEKHSLDKALHSIVVVLCDLLCVAIVQNQPIIMHDTKKSRVHWNSGIWWNLRLQKHVQSKKCVHQIVDVWPD